MPKKLTYVEVKNNIESFIGYILLSKEYKNNQTKLKIQCPEGHMFWMTYANFKKGRRCPYCNIESRKLTYQEVKSYIESFIGYILLSKEYRNNGTKLEIQCPEGHTFWMTYNNFKKGRRCPYCNIESRKLTYQEVKSYIESFIGYILLSREYNGCMSKLKIQCPEGHTFWMSYNSFKYGQRCPYCNIESKKITHQEVKSYIESFIGYILLSKEYKNNQTKLKIQCPEGHTFWMSYSNFQQGGRCPECCGNKKLTNQEIIDKLSFCEDIRETEDEQIEIRCTYCGEWHIPNRHNLISRVRYVEGNDNLESRLYCSQQCKDKCPVFFQKLYPKNFTSNEDDLYTSAEYNLWKKTVLERENYTCEYCEGPANTAHHEHPQKTHPHMALDPDNGIACCTDCHYKYGHKTGTECSTGSLANRVC